MKKQILIALLFVFCFCLLTLTGCQISCVTGHTVAEDPAVEATCTQSGLEAGTHCSVCGITLLRQATKAANGHTASDWIVDKEATHTVAGIKHTKCTVCDLVLETVEIPAGEHSFSEWKTTTAASCMTVGMETRSCDCGASETRTIAASGHTEGAWTVDKDATHAIPGTKSKKCTVCQTTLKTEIIAATGQHAFSEWQTEKEATCTTTGLSKRTCACGEQETQVLTAKHSFGEWSVTTEASCTQLGSQTRSCSCGAKEIEQIPATGHTEGAWIIDLEATHSTCGSKHVSCTTCKTILETQLIAAVAHNFTVVEVAATCTTSGVRTRSCNCGEIEIVYLDALGHDWNGWTTLMQANCVCSGVESRSCQRDDCDAQESKLIAAMGHTQGAWVTVEPSHGASGYRYNSCTACQTVLNSQLLDAEEHKFSEWEISVQATCTASGVRSRSCACGVQETQYIAAYGHCFDAWETTKEVSCTQPGMKTRVCTNENCDAVQTQSIAATGHTEGGWISDVPATHNAAGVEHTECAVCKAVLRTRVVAAIPHKYGEWEVIVAPSATSAGVRICVCECGDVIAEVLPATGDTQ